MVEPLALDEILLLKNGNRIDAIKAYRERTNSGFSLAKKAIVNFEKSQKKEKDNLRKMNQSLNKWMQRKFFK